MRILLVSNHFPPDIHGGAEIVVERLRRELCRRGHTVGVFCGTSNPDEVGPDVTPDGSPVTRVRLRYDHIDDFVSPDTSVPFCAVAKAFRPEVIHFHNLRGLGINLIAAARSLGVPHVLTVHDFWVQCPWATRLRLDGSVCQAPTQCAVACVEDFRPANNADATRLPIALRQDYFTHALGAANKRLAPSRYMTQSIRLSNLCDLTFDHLSHGIDIDQFTPDEPPAQEVVRFLFVGTLAFHKGLEDLLDATARLWQKRNLRGRWRLAIAGDGPLRQRVEADILSGKLGDAVTYLDKVDRSRIPELMRAANVVLMTSRWPENEPLVLLEAIAAGRAQLATDTGGNPELVDDGRSGLLIPAGDVDALAVSMAGYIQRPSMAVEHGRYNAARRHDFDEVVAIDRLLAIYDGACREGPLDPYAECCVVICAGRISPPGVKNLCNELHALHRTSPPLRLIWHEWANDDDWSAAALVWIWDGVLDGGAGLRARALGKPLLAPRAEGSPNLRNVRRLQTYNTLIEAAQMLYSLPLGHGAAGSGREHGGMWPSEAISSQEARARLSAGLAGIGDKGRRPWPSLIVHADRRYSFAERANHHLLSTGWHDAEAWGCWSRGDAAELRLALLEAPRGRTIALEGTVFGVDPETSKPLCIHVFVNGRLAAKDRFSGNFDVELSIPLPDQHYRSEPYGNGEWAFPLTVRMVFENATSPLAAGRGGDPRVIAFALRSLVVRAAEAASKAPTIS